jgi:hypothetical protein
MGLYTWPCPVCYQRQQTYTATSSEGKPPRHSLCASCAEKAQEAGQSEDDYTAAQKAATASEETTA